MLSALLGIPGMGHRRSRCLGLSEKIEISDAFLVEMSVALDDA